MWPIGLAPAMTEAGVLCLYIDQSLGMSINGPGRGEQSAAFESTDVETGVR